MIRRIYLIFVITSIIGTCIAENDTTSTLPPETDSICKNCKCSSNLVDCSSLNISTFFSIPDWAGIRSGNYKTINMSHNSFTKVTPFANLTVVVLDLSHGNINEIEKASFKYLQSMEELDLSYNNISSITLFPDVFNGLYLPEIYTPLRSLRVLKLSYNDIHSLNSDVFEHIPQLTELRLDGNPLKMIDHPTVIAISSLGSLKILDLNNCQLKDLPPYFLHTPRYLEWLDISSNLFVNVPEPLEEAQSLKYLDISKNPIKYIEVNSTTYTPFRRMSILNELHMCYMPELKEIKARSMSGLVKLSILHLNNNPALSRIDAAAFESDDPVGEGKIWPPLVEMYLERNNLSIIENTLIGRWDRLKIIDIRHNPFLCDCTTQWMVNTLALIILETNNNYTSDIICNEPIEMRGKSMVHLEEIHNHMRCSDSYGNRPEKDAAFLVGALIGALIAMPIIMGIMLLYRRGYFTCCNGGGPAAFSRTFYKRTDTNDFL